MQTYEIDGERFSTLEEFYDEIIRVLVPGVNWVRNLDAFDDILYGGFGTPDEGFILRWKNHTVSRQRLGYAETVRQLEKRLERCHPTNRGDVRRELDLARGGLGPTVYDWLIEIITNHDPDGPEANGPDDEDAEDNVRLELA